MPPLLAALLPIADKVLSSVLPDPAARQKAVAEMMTQLQTADLGQMEVNKAEAANSNVFVSGWRPFIGWTCGIALFWQFVGVPLVAYSFVLFGKPYALPVVTLDDHLWELLMGMLGMGALRSFEKIKGVAR